LIAPVLVLGVLVWVRVTVVSVALVGLVVVSGGVVNGVVGVDDVEVDFEPPQAVRISAPKRTATFLTFAG
jgi:hypothetical protein